MKLQTKPRLLSYDILRVLAIFMVVMVHAGAYMVLCYTDPATPEFQVGNLFGDIGRAGVPFFSAK